MPPLLEEVLNVIVENPELSGLWPDDETSKKREVTKYFFESGLLTPLADSQGRLAGFLISYRLPYTDGGFDFKRPESRGANVTCPVMWIRPDLRHTGFIRKLIRAALIENRENLLGGEKLIFERLKPGAPDKMKVYNFPRFNKRFIYGKEK